MNKIFWNIFLIPGLQGKAQPATLNPKGNARCSTNFVWVTKEKIYKDSYNNLSILNKLRY